MIKTKYTTVNKIIEDYKKKYPNEYKKMEAHMQKGEEDIKNILNDLGLSNELKKEIHDFLVEYFEMIGAYLIIESYLMVKKIEKL